jgi:cytochrome c553
MGTSRHRKNHKQKLQAYKARMGQAKNKIQKLYSEAMKKQIEEFIAKRKAESEQETTENNDLNIVQE